MKWSKLQSWKYSHRDYVLYVGQSTINGDWMGNLKKNQLHLLHLEAWTLKEIFEQAETYMKETDIVIFLNEMGAH